MVGADLGSAYELRVFATIAVSIAAAAYVRTVHRILEADTAELGGVAGLLPVRCLALLGVPRHAHAIR